MRLGCAVKVYQIVSVLAECMIKCFAISRCVLSMRPNLFEQMCVNPDARGSSTQQRSLHVHLVQIVVPICPTTGKMQPSHLPESGICQPGWGLPVPACGCPMLCMHHVSYDSRRKRSMPRAIRIMAGQSISTAPSYLCPKIFAPKTCRLVSLQRMRWLELKLSWLHAIDTPSPACPVIPHEPLTGSATLPCQ